ncbi:hypothetical protein [Pantoea agglomerans]|uniref:hypothetical protein n=1 Tax=Enterobacter agglomerans TaxID=549 RepID=UPI00311E8375
MTLNEIGLIALLGLSTLSVFANSAGRVPTTYDGLTLPEAAKDFVSKGYSNVSVNLLNNTKYLYLSSESDVNKCSVVFKVNNNRIENTPSAGADGKLCNITGNDGRVISSRRDQGVWFNDVYRLSSDDEWSLLFTDSCADCQQVKRIHYKNGVKDYEELMTGGDDYKNRKPLNGGISVDKAFLYSAPDESKKTKAYLIKGDAFSLVDMSEDGSFYKINYKPASGKSKVYWVKSDDFDLK